ncbi:MAG: hypothetical protein FJW36_19050 [Acidobacteria bacterium]|nr:hypothetical protein [Acidobacteriota bacterium]
MKLSGIALLGAGGERSAACNFASCHGENTERRGQLIRQPVKKCFGAVLGICKTGCRLVGIAPGEIQRSRSSNFNRETILIEAFSLGVIATCGIFFAVLGISCLVMPDHAGRFLLGFAGSPLKHYAELAIRFLVGGAFLIAAPRALWPEAFRIFGWALVATTAGLLCIPWQWHQRFARQAVPEALRFLPSLGLASLILGGLTLWALVQGPAA